MSEDLFEQYLSAISSGEGKAFNAFMKFIWGTSLCRGEEQKDRLDKLAELLDHKSVHSNIILTRGVCSEVQTALEHTSSSRDGGEAKNFLSGKFSMVLDTQGACARFVDGKWTDLQKLTVSEYSHRQLEIAKDLFITRNLWREIEGKESHTIVYVDDSPETRAIDDLGENPRIVCVDLKREATMGLTSPDNKAKFDELKAHLDKSPPDSVHVVYDFDCTLTAFHLYKTWHCAKNGHGRHRFQTWHYYLVDFIEDFKADQQDS
jgi:hypothetical protein